MIDRVITHGEYGFLHEVSFCATDILPSLRTGNYY